MQSLSGLIVRLDRASGPDRKLDAEITGAVLGPAGWVINPFESPDGWDIEILSDQDGETSYWMEAADIPHLTASLEDAVAFAGQARPQDAAAIMAQAMRQMPSPGGRDTAASYAQQAARHLVKAVLRATALGELGAALGGTSSSVEASG